MHPNDESAQAPDQTLSIGELAEQTGLTPATLRMWEARHGFPEPHRLPSGHRRFPAETVGRVRAVLARQAAGARLEAAIAHTRARSTTRMLSVYAELRRTHPHLAPMVLRKSTLVALSQAIEDECVAQGERALFFGAFQHGRHLRGSLARWTDMSRTAHAVFAFSVGAETSLDGSAIVHVPLAVDSLMRREWSLVCDGTDQPVALAAWELPGQDDVPDGERRFEALWTVDAQAVRDAAVTCADVAADAGVTRARDLVAALDPPSTSPNREASRLFLRALGYVEQRHLG